MTVRSTNNPQYDVDSSSKITELEYELASTKTLLQAATDELDNFSYIVAHDLKEPMRGINSYSNFLLEDCTHKLNNSEQDKLKTLIRLSSRTQNMLDSILHYSRVGITDTENHKINLNDIVSEIIDSLSQNNASIQVSGDLPIITCNPARISEVFLNLITNALIFNDNKHKLIEIGCKETSTNAQSFVYYVKDNGIGIDPKRHDDIFTIFRRLNPKDKYGDSIGAGLTVTKKIINHYEGKIWLESEPGIGSTFYFTLGKTAE